jgi:hypothetical protein
VQGQVAKSTHAGISWQYRIRQAVRNSVDFWPFDGWPVRRGKSVIAEGFPSMLQRRYPAENRTADQHDAYAIARWLKEVGRGPLLDALYFEVAMTGRDREAAKPEGWIL